MSEGADHPRRWDAAIGRVAQLRMQIEAVNRLLPATLPHLAATPDHLDATEARMGRPLDAHHRELLSFADGWPAMFVDMGLLRADELDASGRWADARQRVQWVLDEGPVPGLPPLSDLDVVAAATHAPDMILVRRSGPVSAGGHQVVWFAHDVVQEWDNLWDFMMSVIAYAEERLGKEQARTP